MATAWSFLTLDESQRQFAGNAGYEDDLERYYSWDATVPNHSRVRVGDLAVVRDGKYVLGIGWVDGLADLESGHGAEVLVAGTEYGIEPEDEIAIPIGPLLVTGSLAEWADVVERESADQLPADEAPAVESQPPRAELTLFQVIDSE